MTRHFLSTLFLCFILLSAGAQSREDLERQRNQLKKEIEETEKQLNSNKLKTKESLLQWRLINNKVALQDKVVDNINKDLRILNNNIYTIQKDINRYDRILDTLKKEYAKSMVYAYKNRSNYQFLNFIFSASSFNDAIKRIAYLKSYRSYQEIQGENILRTQELRKQRIADLSGNKRDKSKTLQSQSKELSVLEQQQQEKDRILAELKKQGNSLNKEIAAKKKQQQKVSNAIAAAIKRAQAEARREAMAKAAAEEKRRKDKEKADALAAAKTNASEAEPNTSSSTNTKSVAAETKTKAEPAATKAVNASVLLNAENIALNNSFERNRGSLPWPVDKGFVLMHYGKNKLPSGGDYNISNITIAAEIGSPVKSIFDGTVSNIISIDAMEVVIIQHGKYFTTYSNLSSSSVKVGQDVSTGQVIGRVAADLQGTGSIDFYMSNEKSEFDPESWLRHR